MKHDNWHVIEADFDPKALHHKETVFTIGNGYLGTRGAFEEGYPGDRPGPSCRQRREGYVDISG